MTYLALAQTGLLAAVVTAFASLLRAQQRAHNRREDLLINQLLHATGKTWTPPPAATPPAPPDQPQPRSLVYTATPEQDPIY